MNNYQAVCDLIRQQFASVVWSHKIQEKQSDIHAENYSKLEAANIIAAALTSCGIVGLIFQGEDSLGLKIVTAIFSFVTLAISAYYKSFDPLSKSKENKNAANKLIGIRNELLSLIADCHIQEKSAEEIKERFDEVNVQLNKLYLELPTTSDRAVDRATEALKNNEYSYTEDEIDRFLVSSLKGKVKLKDVGEVYQQPHGGIKQ